MGEKILTNNYDIDDNSNRIKCYLIDKNWFEKWKNAQGEIVFISDKNYQIKSDFGGFAAQKHVTLHSQTNFFV